MKATILDVFEENTSRCYLISSTLDEYILSLPKDYQDYEVQRGIVKNSYLDNLIDTILNKNHIPPIVLVYDKKIVNNKGETISIGKFKILDGLQRTYRLKLIYDTIVFFNTQVAENNGILQKTRIQISKTYKEQLEKINSNSSILFKVIEYYNSSDKKADLTASKIFNRNQWFEIWTGLSSKEEVNKMLLLNAGHKPVKTKHQIELLFNYIYPLLTKAKEAGFSIIRDKDASSNFLSKDRKVGQFLFSNLITSLLSFAEGKPLTSNVDLIQKTQNDYFDEDIFDSITQFDFLEKFVSTTLDLDKCLVNKYADVGRNWMSRETSLVGLFAAAGKYKIEMKIKPEDAIDRINEKILQNPSVLNIDDYEIQRNSQVLSKINFGSVNKKAVYNAVYDILNGDATEIEWKKYFKGE